jgi:hypothetical protein
LSELVFRILLAIAMTVLLPLQGLAVPHSHPGEGNPPGHSEVPHFHLGGHSHGHHHRHTESEKTEDRRTIPPDDADDVLVVGDALAKVSESPVSDHHGAVYVRGESSLALQQRVRCSKNLKQIDAWRELTETLRADLSAIRSIESNICTSGTLPLFLATLSLRL